VAARKEQREQARKEREEREAAERQKAQRKRRFLMLGGVLAAAVVVVVVAIAISSSSSTKKTNASGGVEGAAQSSQLLQGIPQKGITLGKPDAPVTLTEFADLQCPFCRDYTLKTFPTIVAKYVRTGKVKMVFRNYAFISEDSVTAARAAEAAGKQNKLWNFIDVFYNNQGEERSGYVTDAFLKKIGGAAGVDTQKMLSDRQSPEVDQQIAEAQQEAQQAGVNSTPTFLIQKQGGVARKVSQSAFDPNEFSKAIDQALSGGGT
jgi:protein-disulfide isomerase